MSDAENIKYGLSWPRVTNDFNIELALYAHDDLRNSSPKALHKHEHLKNAIQSVISEQHLVWHKWLQRALEAWCYESVVSEWGCSGVGKSSDYGLLALFDVLADPANTKTVIVTNPLEMHWVRCFKYAVFYHSLLPKAFQVLTLKKQNPTGLIYDHERVSKVTGKDQATKQTGIICHSNQQGDSLEDMKRRIGDHERRMRFIVDEPQGCSSAVLGLQINMTAGEGIDYIERFLGNPSGRSDPLGIHSEPLDGDWKQTEQRSVTEWRTRRYYQGQPGICYVRDARDSPAFADSKKFWFMFGPQNQADAKSNYGEDSAEYWTYAVGRLKGEGGANVAITEEDLESYDCYRKVLWQDQWTDYAGLDAAATARDGNELVRVRIGREMGGQIVAALMERVSIRINVKLPDKSGQISKQVVAQLNAWNIPIDRLAGDVTGNQGSIFDTIERMAGGHKGVYRVDASGPCTSHMPVFKGSKIIRSERYFNRSTEMFFNIVEGCRKKQIILLAQSTGEKDAKMIHQLTTRQKEDSHDKLRGKIKIESKKEWRDRNKQKSPDELDALQQVMAMLIDKNILVLNEGATASGRRHESRHPLQGRQRPNYAERKNRRKRILNRY